MKESLKQDLQSLVCVGSVAKLPAEKLNNYPELKKTLIKACGKYKRNTFEFPYPAQTVIAALSSGKNIDFKKEFQFFATPADLAEDMADQIIWDKPEFDILEPSAGHGVLVDAVLGRNKDVKKVIDMVELSELNAAILTEKYTGVDADIVLTQADFLTLNCGKKYDLIIANPPFSKNQDIDHIRKMYSLLKDGGQLISISSQSWTFGQQKKQIDFKNWLENDVAANWVDLERGRFKSSGTGVAGVMITINK